MNDLYQKLNVIANQLGYEDNIVPVELYVDNETVDCIFKSAWEKRDFSGLLGSDVSDVDLVYLEDNGYIYIEDNVDYETEAYNKMLAKYIQEFGDDMDNEKIQDNIRMFVEETLVPEYKVDGGELKQRLEKSKDFYLSGINTHGNTLTNEQVDRLCKVISIDNLDAITEIITTQQFISEYVAGNAFFDGMDAYTLNVAVDSVKDSYDVPTDITSALDDEMVSNKVFGQDEANPETIKRMQDIINAGDLEQAMNFYEDYLYSSDDVPEPLGSGLVVVVSRGLIK